MKKSLFILIIGIMLIIFYRTADSKKASDLIMSNIECLAQNEDGTGVSGHKFCFGTGSLDCNGVKVKRIVGNYK